MSFKVKDIFVIDWDKFEFNEELNAYYCDFFQLFTKIINIRVGSFTEDAYPNHLLIGDWLFIIDGYEINVNDTIFDLTKYSSKYLTIVYDNEIHKETIKEVDNPFST